MKLIVTLKEKSLIKLLILIPLIFALVLINERDEIIQNASTTDRKDDDGSSSSNHSTGANVNSNSGSESSSTVSESIIMSPNSSINEPRPSAARSENFSNSVDERMHVNSIPVSASPKATMAPNIADGQREIYSYARLDRSGSAIHDMLLHHALAFSKGLRYAGACPRDATKLLPDRIQERKELLRMVGVNFFAYSKCMRGVQKVKSLDYHSVGIPELFSPEYMDHLRSTSKPTLVNVGNPRAPRITVHIRRGDVTPCSDTTHFRYLPNQHYLTLIDLYTEKLSQQMKDDTDVNNDYTSEEIEVVIFSESESFEYFDIFRKRGFKVVLDGSIQEVWQSMIFNSDVVILSLSSFSMVPGIFSLALAPKPTTVVYTPFWHDPLPQFDNVGDLYPELLRSTTAELEQMKRVCTSISETLP